MDLPVKSVTMIALALIIISGVAFVLYTQFGTAEDEVGQKSDETGGFLDCIMSNRHDTDNCKNDFRGVKDSSDSGSSSGG